jgi:hypothetical protein
MWIKIKKIGDKNIRMGYMSYIDCLNDDNGFMVKRDGIFYVKLIL